MLHAFLAEPDVGRCASLRRVIASGEALTADLVRRCHERLPAELHNLYGPTEAAIDVTHWPCRRGEERQVMLIGHQPALQDLAMLLCRGEGDRRRLSGKFPTAALATFAVPMAWAELAPDCARLTDYVKPRELEGS